MKKSLLTSLFICTFCVSLMSQKADLIIPVPLLKHENSFAININSNGWGVGFRYGSAKTYKIKKTWDFNFNFVRSPKQYRYQSFQSGARSFFYGKENNFYNFDLLRGRQKMLSDKPYWGGVELSWFYFGGLNVGLSKPIYIEVIDYSTNVVSLEKYDVNKYDLNNILGKGPFSKGLSETTFHLGPAFKFGLNAEFGTYRGRTQSLEAGLVINTYINSVKIMGFAKPTYFMPKLYIAYRFGKRYNSY